MPEALLAVGERWHRLKRGGDARTRSLGDRRDIRDRAQALASSPSTNALATLTDSWRVMRSKLAAWNDTLTRRAIEREGRDL